MDLISIIVPVYNVEKYLRRCLDSIINQSYKNIEVLLIDDGSTDNSGKICDEYKKRDTRIKVLHEKNEGQATARNLGIRNAKGKYISFIDSDDFVDIYFIEKLYSNIIEESADISVCATHKFFKNKDTEDIINDKINKTIQNFNSQEAIKQLLLTNGKLNNYPVNKLYKKELFNNIKFPEGKKFEDIDIMYRLFDISKKISASTEILYYYYIHDDSTTGNLKLSNVYDKIDIIQERDKYIREKYYLLKEDCNEYLVHAFFIIFKQLLKLRGKQIKDDEKYNDLKKTVVLSKKMKLNFQERVLLLLIKINNGFLYECIYKLYMKGKKEK